MDKLTNQKLVDELYNFARTSVQHTMSQAQVDQVKEEAQRLVQVISLAVKEESAEIARRMNEPISNAFDLVEKELKSIRKELKRNKQTDYHPNMVV